MKSVLSVTFRLGVHHSDASLGVFPFCYYPLGGMKAVSGDTAESGSAGTSRVLRTTPRTGGGAKSLLCTMDMGLPARNI